MPQDAFTLRKISSELSSMFVGGKISKINQPEKDRLSLLIYTHIGTVKLDLDFSAKFCRISANEKRTDANPKNAPNFCMLLRKHLQNAEITAVGQIGFERIIYFDFLCFSEFSSCEMRLYAEIMGKYANAVLTKDGVIVGALKSTSLESAKRVTLTGAKYVLPEKQDKADPTNLAELNVAFAERYGYTEGGTAKFISERVTGIAYTTADEMVSIYGENLTAQNVYDYVNGEDISPCVTFADGAPADFKTRSTMSEQKAYPTVLEAQAAYYDYAVGLKQFTDAKRKLFSALESAIKKTEKRLGQIHDKLLECDKIDGVKLAGELITANIYAVQRGDKELKAINYYDENCAEITIKLDPMLSPSQNAQRYFKRYAKLKRTLENLTVQKSETESKLNYLQSIEESINSAENETDLHGIREELISLSLIKDLTPQQKGKKNKAVEKPYRTFIFDGFTVICGRNNVQNERLTKSLSESDIWLHTKTFHSSHVGILTDGRKATDEVIKFAAEVCAYYSAAREKDKVPVDYTSKKYVKRPNGSPTGFVVYTDFKTILVAPDAHTEERQEDE